ncbi:hypothetical protein [Chitinophaga vietnamensis]|uniref:hypothetical protein n=1 Tax=Chitinophaga vietnamensis TaxID=2593957 RepID=UPI0011783448|nr:hypothetical protein [Chitinophaga vietnamensis]
MNYKKFIVFFISFFTVLFGNVIYTLSCGPEPDPYDYYVSFFNPYGKGAGYEPFYYIGMLPFYDDPTPAEATVNTADWAAYAGKNVQTEDVDRYIYHFSREQIAQVADYSAKGGNGTLPDSAQRNTFVRFLLRNSDAARYLLFAKDCEPQVVNVDAWTPAPANDSIMALLHAEGLQLREKTKSREIRDRYAFQLIRLTHFRHLYQDAMNEFDQYFGKKETNSLMYYKSLSLKAGALLRYKDTVQSAYLFSRVFDKAPSMRIPAFTSLMWTNTKAEQVYALCANNREKANVAAIFGVAYASPSLAPLRNVYQFDPSSPALNTLLVREINKLEDGNFGPDLLHSLDSNAWVYNYYSSETFNYKGYTKQLQHYVDSIADKGKVSDPDLWRVASAYLSVMLRDLPGARSRLDNAKVKDPNVKDQWEIINLLVNINQQKKIDSAFENKLLASFKWLDTKTAHKPNNIWAYGNDKEYFFNKAYRNLLFAVLAPVYKRQGDFVKEALVTGRCDSLNMNTWGVSGSSVVDLVTNDMTPDQLQKLNSFLHQAAKTPYEAYLSSFFPKALNIDQAIGVSYVRLHDFKNAQSWLKKVPAKQQLVTYQVFQDQLQDFGEDTADAKHPKSITQLQFCNQMLQLQERMKTAPKDARAYYDYATALFNISYYGKTWHFMRSFRPSGYWYTTAKDSIPADKQYFGCYNAEAYYLKAAQAATDKEFRARCFFMAARCSQKHTPPNNDDKKYYGALVRNRYFPVLVANYKDTRLYQEVYGQCSYLRDFVRRSK